MKISDIALKRYTAGKGKSLKWYEWVMNPIQENVKECYVCRVYSRNRHQPTRWRCYGNTIEEYKEWWDNNYHCLGVTGL